MAEQFQTSFIPKKTNQVSSKRRSRGVLSLLATIIFVLTLAAVGGVFLYEEIVEGSIVRKKESLERARAAFEPSLIEELARLDARLSHAETILAQHVAPSRFFELLETLTVRDVQFKTLTYTSDPQGILLNMSGEASTFNAVAVQSDIFGKHQSIRNPIFSGLNLNAIGRVDFTVDAIVEPGTVAYEPGNGSFMDDLLPELGDEEPLDEAGAATTSTSSPTMGGETQ